MPTLVLLAHVVLNAAPMTREVNRRNVEGTQLQLCCAKPHTGYARDGLCAAIDNDHGSHTVCAVVTQAFLEFTRFKGNDLITPRPDHDFPGLKEGDRWCLCAVRWREAVGAGVAPPVVLESTDARTLDFVDLAQLQAHTHRPN